MSDLELLVGNLDWIENNNLDGSLVPFSDIVCDFLDVLSKRILESKIGKSYPDIATFGFWCRKSNINRIKSRYDTNNRLGRGIAFHIAPSNVPINTFYSLAFGLLSSCKNLVRTPSKRFDQIEIVSNIISELLEKDFVSLSNYIALVRYDKDSEWTDHFSKSCMLRIVWGGDATIEGVGESKLRPRAKEIRFSDRYSFAVIDVNAVAECDDIDIMRLAHRFYNDTYLIDQNACSSPHLILWHTSEKDDARMTIIKHRFWEAVLSEVSVDEMEDIKYSEKYTRLCDLVMTRKEIGRVERYDNRLYVCGLNSIPDDIEDIRGVYGLFFEYSTDNINDLLRILSEKTQSCMYFGIDKDVILSNIIKYGYSCIDRIVPIGNALDISVIWDGYDIISEMTRIINYD